MNLRKIFFINIFIIPFIFRNINTTCNDTNFFIENKIHYIQKKIDHLNFLLNDFQEIIEMENELLDERICLTNELIERLQETYNVENKFCYKSAKFRLYNWSYIFLKKINSSIKKINHNLKQINYETERAHLDCDNKFLINNKENCGCKISHCINNLLKQIDYVENRFELLKKEKDELCARINEAREQTIQRKDQYATRCCWL